jgi:hypothetical protein
MFTASDKRETERAWANLEVTDKRQTERAWAKQAASKRAYMDSARLQ